MTATFPNQYNTFIPSFEASGKLVVDFSRNPKEFALPEYVQYIPVEKNVGRYLEMTIEMAGRLLNADGADLAWPDGTEAPKGYGNLESHEFKPFTTKRFATPYNIGELAADQAQWDVLAHHGRIHAQRMMTFRTLKMLTLAQTTGNWPTGHTATVSSIGVGYHDQSTTARKDIKNSLDYAAEQILLSTLGAVNLEDMVFVCSPTYARKIAKCQEIVDHIKGSTTAVEEIKKGIGPNTQFGLPSTLYGYKTIVEKTVRVTSRKGATAARSFVMAEAKPMLVSRPGGLEGVEGAPSFSTLSCFLKEEMTVESKHDRDNRRHQGRVVDDFAEILTAGISGYLFQEATAP